MTWYIIYTYLYVNKYVQQGYWYPEQPLLQTLEALTWGVDYGMSSTSCFQSMHILYNIVNRFGHFFQGQNYEWSYEFMNL
jgi:hypothetical protein